MDFRFSVEDEAWRREIHAWIEGEFGAGWRGFRGEDAEADFVFAAGVRQKLAAKGWTAPAYPAEAGGLGASFAG